MSDFSFYLVTDPHYFDESFGRSGSAYEARSRTDQKCVAETPAILDAGFAQIAADRETRVILIPGDLVYRGEYQSHVGFRKRLYRLQEAGKKIYLITARHDYAENPCEFIGDRTVPVAGMERSDLRDFYREFGFDDAIAEHRESMSYVAQLAPGLRLLALNCDGDCKDFKGLWPEQLDWAVAQIQAAHAAGERIIAMTHYPLLPFSAVMGLIGDAHLTDWEQTANTLADAGLELIFTGHMHAQAVTEHISPAGNTITDVQTGCFVGCPCAYRKVTVAPDGQVNIRSYTIDDFDYDKGGRTAAEYLQYMLLFCGLNLMAQSVNTTVLDGIFCAGGDAKFDMQGNIGAMWCFSVPLGFLAAFWLKLPVMVVYCIVNLDEIVKLPAVYLHYKKYVWVRNITRDIEE